MAALPKKEPQFSWVARSKKKQLAQSTPTKKPPNSSTPPFRRNMSQTSTSANLQNATNNVPQTHSQSLLKIFPPTNNTPYQATPQKYNSPTKFTSTNNIITHTNNTSHLQTESSPQKTYSNNSLANKFTSINNNQNDQGESDNEVEVEAEDDDGASTFSFNNQHGEDEEDYTSSQQQTKQPPLQKQLQRQEEEDMEKLRSFTFSPKTPTKT